MPLTNNLIHERDAARILGLSVAWLQRKRWEGGGPPYIKIGRAVRYDRDALLRWIDEHRIGGSSEKDRKAA
jgi:predicted DNA-binding transcriptional regulator AlpA